jgi:hypothetical protein
MRRYLTTKSAKITKKNGGRVFQAALDDAKKFARAAKVLKHSSTEFAESGDFLITNSLPRVLGVSALKVVADPSFGGSVVKKHSAITRAWRVSALP